VIAAAGRVVGIVVVTVFVALVMTVEVVTYLAKEKDWKGPS